MSKPSINILSDPLNLLALAFLLIWGTLITFFRPIGGFGVETDFYGDLVFYSRQWMDSGPNVMNGFRGPFYYILLGVLSKVFDAYAIGKVISVLSATAGLVIFGRFVRTLWGPAMALAACLFLAANTTMLEYTYRAGTDLLFWLFVVSVVALLLGREQPSLRRVAFAGLLAAFAYLTRYNGLALLPGGALGLLIAFGFSRKNWMRAGVFVAVWVLTVSPWAIYLWQQAGNPLWNKNFQNIAIEIYTASANLATQGGFMSWVNFTSMGEVIRVDPSKFLLTILANIPNHILRDAKDLVYWPWAIASALGFIVAWKSWMQRRALAFLAIGLIQFVVLLPVFYNPRFMVPLLPWWAVGAAGLVMLVERFAANPNADSSQKKKGAKKQKARRLSAAMVAVLVVFGVPWAVMSARNFHAAISSTKHGGVPKEYLDLADQVKKKRLVLNERTPIAARKPHIGYLLGAPVIPIPVGGQDELRNCGAHYILASGVEAIAYPVFNNLMAPQSAEVIPKNLEFVAFGKHEMDATKTRVASLYRVKDPLPFEPRVQQPFRPKVDSPPQFSRIDFLRFQIASWYLAWNSDLDPNDMLAKLDSKLEATPELQMLRGDIALEEGDLVEAERLYREAEKSWPGDERLVLRFLSLQSLVPGREAFSQAGARAAAAIPGAQGESADWWFQLGLKYLRPRQHAACLGAFAMSMHYNEHKRETSKLIGYTLFEVRRFSDAKTILQNYVKNNPGDAEAKRVLENINDAIAELEKIGA